MPWLMALAKFIVLTLFNRDIDVRFVLFVHCLTFDCGKIVEVCVTFAYIRLGFVSVRPCLFDLAGDQPF